MHTLTEILKHLPEFMMWTSIVSGAVQFLIGNFGQGIYWTSAGLLNFSVIYLIPRGI